MAQAYELTLRCVVCGYQGTMIVTEASSDQEARQVRMDCPDCDEENGLEVVECLGLME